MKRTRKKYTQSLERERQKSAPLLDAILAYEDAAITPFHTPGHKLGTAIPAELADVIGRAARIDASDEVFHPSSGHDVGIVREEAEVLLAEAVGADHSYFLVNGASQGIQAALLALKTAGYDGSVLLPRNCHVSLMQGLILSGLSAEFIRPRFSAEWGMPLPPHPAELEEGLKRKNVSAVFVTRPDYFGLCVDIAEVVRIAHQKHLPFLVDEAHGPHLGWTSVLPESALQLDADVVVQSPHKLLTSLTGSSWLHVRSRLIPKTAIFDGLSLVSSTSPSHLLLASLDATRRQMALLGQQLLTRTVKLAREVRREIAEIEGLRCLTEAEAANYAGDFDVTKILIDVSELGITGPDAEKWLRNEAGVQVEMATSAAVLVLVTIGDTEESACRLLTSLRRMAKTHMGRAHVTLSGKGMVNSFLSDWPVSSASEISLRDALLGRKKFVGLDQAAGEVAAEWIIPYPPGIPLLVPGEVITKDIVEYCRRLLTLGISIRGMADPNGRMIRIWRGKATE